MQVGHQLLGADDRIFREPLRPRPIGLDPLENLLPTYAVERHEDDRVRLGARCKARGTGGSHGRPLGVGRHQLGLFAMQTHRHREGDREPQRGALHMG